jgi:hypothetical protein
MSLCAGTRWCPEIPSALGAAGMGEVYRARDTWLDRIVLPSSFRATWLGAKRSGNPSFDHT